MNTTAKLHIREWQKSEVVFTLLDWRPHEGLAFVLDDNNRRKVIRFDLPGLLAQAGIGLGVAFPIAAPTTIIETRLLPPPCRTTEKEAECLRAAAAEARSPNSRTQSRKSPDLPNWELVWLRHRNEVLLPVDEDKAEFEKRLEVLKVKKHQEYEARKQELEDWRTKTIGQMIYLGGGRFYRELRNFKSMSKTEQVEGQMRLLEAIFTRPLHESFGRLHGGYLNWTPEMARYEPEIRDPVLHERWAMKHHLKLAEMNADKAAFLNWYRAHCLAPSPRASDEFLERMCLGASARMADDLLCAEVRFVANFSDGSRVWLADCPRRDLLLTAKEQQPFETPVPISTLAGQTLDSTACTEPVSETVAAAEILARAGQQARADAEEGAATLGERTKDIAAILGKVPELFADPLVAAARDASIKQGVPEVFTWWVFQEWRFNKFPTVGDAIKRSGLRPKLEQAGLAFSRASFSRWLKTIREELEKRGLMPKRSLARSSSKARDFDVAQAADTSSRPMDADEPPEAFVKWVEDRDAAGSMPTEQDVLAYLRDKAGDFDLASCSENELQTTAAKWLKDAVRILDSVPPDRLETNEEDSPL